MKKSDVLGIIPEQWTGKEIEAEANETLPSKTAAQALYDEAKERLLSVNNWHKIAGSFAARFQIIDENGNEVNRQAKTGDHLKIDIPGPGSIEGNEYDWVVVEDVKEVNRGSLQSIGFRVRPTENPFGKRNETAHFYSTDATSTFIVTRENVTVRSWIIDRNLVPNTESSSLADKVRDVMVGVSGIAGVSKVQWQGLADGLIKI